ncbi:hypothetical protein EVAR_76554_1 [Eumeta japonica]|uniref:Uncharacterized protein n=1 Tax=Eumeta variegata TaxID=151549 RepID=A0A4C1T5Y1_EUMVA|nr:hypothetical protein EVAR_76554_1 [Eumeta japonica]
MLNSKKRRRRTFEAITVDAQEEPITKKKKNDMGLSAHEDEYSLPDTLQMVRAPTCFANTCCASQALSGPRIDMLQRNYKKETINLKPRDILLTAELRPPCAAVAASAD